MKTKILMVALMLLAMTPAIQGPRQWLIGDIGNVRVRPRTLWLHCEKPMT